MYTQEEGELLRCIVAKPFFKGPESKFIRLRRPYSLRCNYTNLFFQCESSHRQYINEWLRLRSSKILLNQAVGKI